MQIGVGKALRERGKAISEEALRELVNRIGPNARQLHSEAEKLARQALDFQKKLVGDEHVGLAEALNTLTEVLRMEGKLSEAEANSLFAAYMAQIERVIDTVDRLDTQ